MTALFAKIFIKNFLRSHRHTYYKKIHSLNKDFILKTKVTVTRDREYCLAATVVSFCCVPFGFQMVGERLCLSKARRNFERKTKC